MGTATSARDAQPGFIYGTAWKKDETRRLVKEALAAGFRRFDTAAQPRHYQEHLVGDALRDALADGLITREDVYIQTKYTTPAGQDLTNMPYDPNTSLDTQIHTSIASSLHNLRFRTPSCVDSHVDCLLLHSPLPTIKETLQAWKVLETYVPEAIRTLGISNVTLSVLETIYDNATVKPAVVQNRFYEQTGYDVSLRAYCKERGITYQSFWTLTGNPGLLDSKIVGGLADAADVGKAVALYALVLDLGVEVLNGTTSAGHMREDLDGVVQVAHWAQENGKKWDQITAAFRRVLGDI